jgi:hypothetical protein
MSGAMAEYVIDCTPCVVSMVSLMISKTGIDVLKRRLYGVNGYDTSRSLVNGDCAHP